jgi:Zn-finger nucleic acid-binding protein
MNRKNFGGMSGVVVDVCKKHGTWFDEGELPRVLEFVASGGLERAKRREDEEASRLRRDAAVASVRSQGSFPVETHEPAALGAAFMASLLELLR